MMLKSEILDAGDITTPRAAIDFVAWAKGKADELGATAEAKRYARSGAALPKRFYDEIYPLALFVEREFCDIPDAVVTPNLNSDNFDATVAFRGSRAKIFVEITQAKDGYDDSLRLEVLAREGGVSLTGPITRVSGRRGSSTRLVEVQAEMVLHDDLLAKHLSLVEAAVRAKAGRHYGKDFILLVVVDDYLPFRGESDHTRLNDLVTTTLLSADLDFSRLIILGISGKLLLSYRLPRYSRGNPTL